MKLTSSHTILNISHIFIFPSFLVYTPISIVSFVLRISTLVVFALLILYIANSKLFLASHKDYNILVMATIIFTWAVGCWIRGSSIIDCLLHNTFLLVWPLVCRNCSNTTSLCKQFLSYASHEFPICISLSASFTIFSEVSSCKKLLGKLLNVNYIHLLHKTTKPCCVTSLLRPLEYVVSSNQYT